MHEERDVEREKMLQVSPKGNFYCFFLSSHELTPSSFLKAEDPRYKKLYTRKKDSFALIKFCQTIKIIFSGKKRQVREKKNAEKGAK